MNSLQIIHCKIAFTFKDKVCCPEVVGIGQQVNLVPKVYCLLSCGEELTVVSIVFSTNRQNIWVYFKRVKFLTRSYHL